MVHSEICIGKLNNVRKVFIIFLRIRKRIGFDKKFFHKISKICATVEEDASLQLPLDDQNT